MDSKKTEPPVESGPVDLLGGGQRETMANGPKTQPIKGAPTHLIGGPKVVVANKGHSTTVGFTDTPWGWGNLERVFLHKPLHPRSIGAEKYAAELRQRIADAAWIEHARRERQKDLKLSEAIARSEGRL
jgi:hypothetical protein